MSFFPDGPWRTVFGIAAVAGFGAAISLVSVSRIQAQDAAPAAKARRLRPEAYGAVGDGKADDTAALQKALADLHPGDTLVFPKGKTYCHKDVLTVGVPGVRLTGPGTLRATNEERSCLRLDADRITVDGKLTVTIASTTRRWNAYEQHKVRLSGHQGIVLRDITVDGSAAAGIYVGNGCSKYLLDRVTVQNTRADGIHNTDGVHDATIRRPVIRNVGDDGVAVVSYNKDPNAIPCRNITIESPRFLGNVWGRGFSVVGGEDITFRNVYAENSNAAAIYIGAEGEPWYTFPAKRVRVLGGELKNANQSKTVDHGAVLIYNGRDGQPGYTNEDIEVSDLRITDTNPKASRQVGILGDARHVSLRNLHISGGPDHLLTANVPADRYNTTGWTYNGPQADHIGYR